MSISNIGGRLAALVFTAACTTGALAGAQRTFVASTGNDAYPCSLVQPCRSFAAAVAAANAGGEVIVLDSAGYGTVSITKSITIAAPAGVYAGISVPGPAAGVDINAPSGNIVLRGLTINGAGGDVGVALNSAAKLLVERCEIARPGLAGIVLDATNAAVTIAQSVLRESGGHAIWITAGQYVVVDGSRIQDNFSVGILVEDGMAITVRDSILSGNAVGISVSLAPAKGVAQVTVSHSIVTKGFLGIGLNATFPAIASVLLDGTTITNQATYAIDRNDPATQIVYTRGNNTFGYYGGDIRGGEPLTPCCGY